MTKRRQAGSNQESHKPDPAQLELPLEQVEDTAEETADPEADQADEPGPGSMFDLSEAEAPDEAEQPPAEGSGDALSPAEPEPSATPEEPEAEFFRFGSKVFKTKAELEAYVADLENKEAYRQGLIDAVTPEEPAAPAEPDPSEILFEDPKKALELHAKKLREEWEAERRAEREAALAQERHRQAWDGFYSKHPDLKAYPELVKLVADQNKETFGKLKVSQAFPELAKATRAYISKLRKDANGGVELPSGPAVTSGSGGVKVPATKTVAPVTSFVDEVRQRNRRKQG